jgi:hypothetical protein
MIILNKRQINFINHNMKTNIREIKISIINQKCLIKKVLMKIC